MATIAELLLHRGDQQARDRQRQGELANQTWQRLADIASQYGQGVRHDQELSRREAIEAPIRAQESQMRGLQIQSEQAQLEDRHAAQQHDAAFRDAVVQGVPDDELVKIDPERADKFIAGRDAVVKARQQGYMDRQKILMDTTLGLEAVPDDLRADAYAQKRQELLAHRIITEKDAPEQFDPVWFASTLAHAKTLSPKDQAAMDKTKAETEKLRAETAGTLPETPAQKEIDRHNREMERIQGLGVDRSAAAERETERHNRAMEENARNAKVGRPVIAGDAEDLSNFVTSLDDLDVLRKTIAPIDRQTGQPIAGATGVGAQMGAALPAWVTDITGVGVEAKQKQALIDRVKQVIGKTLEGGVLRKEDEAKYEKILPTIKDTGDVVVSKLSGLQDAIQKRLGRRLDSMADAGFDVSRYRTRGVGAVPKKPTAEELIQKYGGAR